jgi:hypothetical protein
VRDAAEMRNSFDYLKSQLAGTEDLIINSDYSVQGISNSPRQLLPNTPPSSLQENIHDDTLRKKKRDTFRRALTGLRSKSSSDLVKIEEMLVQLLRDVERIKVDKGQQPNKNQPGESFS